MTTLIMSIWPALIAWRVLHSFPIPFEERLYFCAQIWSGLLKVITNTRLRPPTSECEEDSRAFPGDASRAWGCCDKESNRKGTLDIKVIFVNRHTRWLLWRCCYHWFIPYLWIVFMPLKDRLSWSLRFWPERSGSRGKRSNGQTVSGSVAEILVGRPPPLSIQSVGNRK